jgi:predicted RNase H-like nuclease (RuvC/YqgF family)
MGKYECLTCGEIYQDVTHLRIHCESISGCEKNIKKVFDCDNCDKKFTTKWSKERHEQTGCKKKNNKELEMIKDKFDKLETELQNTKEELEKTKEIVTVSNNQIQHLQSQIKRKPGRPKKIINQDNSNTNINNHFNNTNTNNTNSNNTNNITNKTKNVYQLNYINFGEEDLSKLNNTEKWKICSSSYCSLAKLTELVHCNPRIPEQRNVYLDESNPNNCYIFKDGKLKSDHLDDIVDDIIIDRSIDLTQILNDDKVVIKDDHRTRCNDLLDRVKRREPKQIRLVKKDIIGVIISENKLEDIIKLLK